MSGRRTFLKTATGLVAFAAFSLHRPHWAHAAEDKPHWGYEGHGGPDQWGGLHNDYAACGTGSQQSPIDLRNPTPAILGDIAIDWRPTALKVVNNGHTIQVDADTGSKIVIGGKSFALLQFHFHHKSEHGLNGKQLPMELHFVHSSPDGTLAVLGVFLEAGGEPGAAVETIDAIWKLAPAEKGAAESAETIDPGALLPVERSFYRYYGSLTTPPCSEIVTWTVYHNPVAITQAQIDAFATLFENNARPFQALNRRFLLGTF